MSMVQAEEFRVGRVMLLERVIFKAVSLRRVNEQYTLFTVRFTVLPRREPPKKY